MTIETLGEAWKLGWRIRVRCLLMGPNKSDKRQVAWCDTTTELDMKTLVWTRGNIPLDDLRFRFRCPKCGNDKIRVWFEIPNNSVAVAARGKLDIDDYREGGD